MIYGGYIIFTRPRRGAQDAVVHLKQLLFIYVPIAQLAEHMTFNHGVESSNLSGHTIHQLVLKIYEPFEVEGISKRVDEGRYLGKDRIAQGPYPCQID